MFRNEILEEKIFAFPYSHGKRIFGNYKSQRIWTNENPHL